MHLFLHAFLLFSLTVVLLIVVVAASLVITRYAVTAERDQLQRPQKQFRSSKVHLA